jgi:hypothetical protein
MFSSSTDDLMARCVWASALVLVMIAAPIAPTVCEGACGSHAMDTTGGHGHHHGYAATGGTAISGAPHACDHSAHASLAVQQALQALTAPTGEPVQRFSLSHPGRATADARRLYLGHSPPGPFALITPLRV